MNGGCEISWSEALGDLLFAHLLLSCFLLDISKMHAPAGLCCICFASIYCEGIIELMLETRRGEGEAVLDKKNLRKRRGGVLDWKKQSGGPVS